MSLHETPAFDAAAARSEVLAALDEEDPITTLRAVAIDLAGRWGRKGAETAFVSACEWLSEAGREEEATTVAYVLDMMNEW